MVRHRLRVLVFENMGMHKKQLGEGFLMGTHDEQVLMNIIKRSSN